MKKRATILEIGYHRFAFVDSEKAIAIYELLSCSTPVTSHYGDLPDGRKNIRHIKVDGNIDLSITQVDVQAMELEKTEAEIKAEVDAKADIDVDADVVIDLPRLSAPAEQCAEPEVIDI